LQYRLLTDEGEFLMLAVVSLEASCVAFFQYDSNTSLFDSSRPSFVMAFSQARAHWLLMQERCEHCQYLLPHLSCAFQGGKQQVASVWHARRAVGEGVSYEMEVRIPGIFSNGGRVLWCPVSQNRVELAKAPSSTRTTQALVTKRPTWNAKVECLVLDFRGRDILASAKNFQLTLRQQPEFVICQFGKLSDDMFALDCRFPLSIIQAFAISMTTLFWK